MKPYIKENKDYVSMKNFKVQIERQKTGYGYKSFLICPECGKRRTKLYSKSIITKCLSDLKCRSCVDENIYKYRTNMYDSSLNLIRYKMFKLARSIEIVEDLKFPFEPLRYIWSRPKYMRHDKWEIVIRQLIILEQLRMNAINFKTKYSAKYINELLENIELQRDIDLDYFPIETIKEIEFNKAYKRLPILESLIDFEI